MAEFELNLEEEIFSLHDELKKFSYRHGRYFSFKVYDPKPRIIHKAEIKDRIVHQAVYRVLYPIFDKSFIFDSYSSRLAKGNHKTVGRLNRFVQKLSQNYNKRCYAVKFDIEKFFHNIDHHILLRIIKKKITCLPVIWLITQIVGSFESSHCKGLPLGNVTSQLFANLYLNPLDYFVKHLLKEKFYLRYCDDFIIIKKNNNFKDVIQEIDTFCGENLLLKLKIAKLKVRKLKWGIDFLGYVLLSYHLVLRPRTRKRMIRKIREKKEQLKNNLISKEKFEQTLNSYYGVLKHCDSYKLRRNINGIIKGEGNV